MFAFVHRTLLLPTLQIPISLHKSQSLRLRVGTGLELTPFDETLIMKSKSYIKVFFQVLQLYCSEHVEGCVEAFSVVLI